MQVEMEVEEVEREALGIKRYAVFSEAPPPHGGEELLSPWKQHQRTSHTHAHTHAYVHIHKHTHTHAHTHTNTLSLYLALYEYESVYACRDVSEYI